MKRLRPVGRLLSHGDRNEYALDLAFVQARINELEREKTALKKKYAKLKVDIERELELLNKESEKLINAIRYNIEFEELDYREEQEEMIKSLVT
ncbi:MAG TPA: hypothetical protein VJ302_32825 [Blastocatellia bacterium]|nr:hypothetical protein [Blastocatellia bacterium]